MARGTFTVAIPGPCRRYHLHNGTLEYTWSGNGTPHRYASETATGTTRKQKPKAGYIPPTAYSFVRTAHDQDFGRLTFNYRTTNANDDLYIGYLGAYDPNWGYPPNFYHKLRELPPRSSTSLTNECLAKVRNKLRAEQVNLAVAWRERDKTGKLLLDVMQGTVDTITDLKRGRFKKAFNRLGLPTPGPKKQSYLEGSTLPARWLEVQFGVKPLLSDLHGAAEALSERPASDWLVTVKASVKRSGVESKPFYNGGQYGLLRPFGSCTWQQGVFIRVDYHPAPSRLLTLKQLGLTNPAAKAWELTPFSFALDYFYDVGGWLSSLDATLGLDIVGVSTSHLASAKYEFDYLSGFTYTSSGNTADVSVDFRTRYEYYSLLREASLSLPFPTYPSVGSGLSLTRFANLSSVLTQLVK